MEDMYNRNGLLIAKRISHIHTRTDTHTYYL